MPRMRMGWLGGLSTAKAASGPSVSSISVALRTASRACCSICLSVGDTFCLLTECVQSRRFDYSAGLFGGHEAPRFDLGQFDPAVTDRGSSTWKEAQLLFEFWGEGIELSQIDNLQ